MKTLNSKIFIGLAMFALLIGSNGCMTQSAVQYAKGYPKKAWINNDFGYDYSDPDTNPKPTNPKPQPACYILVPFTVPADVATSPFQGIYYGLNWLCTGMGHAGG